MPESDFASVVPAQLSFLAIYNTLLGPTDETLNDQVVFYTSRTNRLRRIEGSAAENSDDDYKDEWNKRLRQIGLAQGMVNFARNFSGGKAVDYVDTDKSRVVVHELEKNWWILASIDLTRIPSDPTGTSARDAANAPSYQYSSREVCPPHLLIQQLRRAYSTFLLHHDFTLEDLYQHVGRPTFCSFLERFWERFAWSWEVLLSGNPAVEMYNGIKLSAAGELGIGVGEEEWGSGERAVLEDFVFSMEGLVDLIVSRFGDPSTLEDDAAKTGSVNQRDDEPWLGSDSFPRPSDGVIFSGVGAISRSSLVQISQWMEWIYTYGDDAYGVSKDPTSPRRQKPRKRKQRGRLHSKDPNYLSASTSPSQPPNSDRNFSPGIPRPLVVGTPSSQNSDAPQNSDKKDSPEASGESSPAASERGNDWSGFGTEAFKKYLTLGYGSSWSISGSPSPHPRVAALKEEETPNAAKQKDDAENKEPSEEDSTAENKSKIQDPGRFIIGLQEDLDKPKDTEDGLKDNSKDMHRTLHVHLAGSENMTGTKLRTVVYVRQPFMFTFLLDPETPSLTSQSLYQTIHHQLGPLQKPLSTSTSPTNAAIRISTSETIFDSNKRFSTKNQPVYDLVYDPSNLTIRSSIPNIPDGVTGGTQAWSRIESLSLHHRLLSTYIETRARPLELERTCKTNRGWWVVWVRMSDPPSLESNPNPDLDSENLSTTQSTTTDEPIPHGPAPQEAFLIKRASDHTPSHGRSTSGSRFLWDLGGASPRLSASRADMGPGKLVEGLGLDARRYIGSLLRLNK